MKFVFMRGKSLKKEVAHSFTWHYNTTVESLWIRMKADNHDKLFVTFFPPHFFFFFFTAKLAQYILVCSIITNLKTYLMCAETLYTRQQQQTELFFQTNKVSPHLCGGAQLNKNEKSNLSSSGNPFGALPVSVSARRMSKIQHGAVG